MNRIDMEPLQSILKIYQNKDEVFKQYLPSKTIEKIQGSVFYNEKEETLFLDENVTFVKKNTGLIDKKGKVICIRDDLITLKTINKANITMNKNEYYIFIQQRKNKKNNRNFYKSLLNELNEMG
tara:strand:+ start:575 stop:946 length:372 start_codon:yes stop_codon:yes gene_type:complete